MARVEAPPEFTIGLKQRIVRADRSTIDRDPRGIIWLYEPPNPRSRYVLGCDPTNGRTGWNRFSRSGDDKKIDNGAIEVLKLGRGEPGSPHFVPATQVAEYAAPIDPYDLASVANVLGRMYGGRDEDGQALAIIEVYPGPGGPTQRTLQEKFGYTNLYRWQYLDTGEEAKRITEYGWYSNRQSMQHLWTRGLRAIHRKQVVLRSSHLIEELADCEMDMVRMRGSAARGHDDRATALLLAIWAGFNYTFDIEPRQSDVTTGPKVEWQATDVSSVRMYEQWDERLNQIIDDAEREFA